MAISANTNCNFCLLYLFFVKYLIYCGYFYQHHYCYNVTGQSNQSEGSYKPARIKSELQFLSTVDTRSY